tara:strand:- start:767 stop:1819 length:1053 start_codon:yes stop_codon:yes gene_type:complete
MIEITPRICIDGREVDYLEGSYKSDGGLTSSEITFKLPLTYGGMKKLWNKEVTFYLNEFDSTPMFRGWVKRTNETFDDIEIMAMDAIGYMLKGGEQGEAKIVLDDRTNLDGLTVGAAISKAITLAKLDTKIKTDMIGNTEPLISSVREPLRGTLSVKNIIEELLVKAIDKTNQDLPRPNIIKIVDDGEYSQLVIELETRLDDNNVKHVFDEYNNIESLNIINKKLPTVITVNGNNVSATFTHDSALEAFDRKYLEVSNDKLNSYAECKEFAARIFQANLFNQYEYGIESFDGAYLVENEVVRVEAEDPQFSGNYRVMGKGISFSPSDYSVNLNINRKPPTLAEYISSRDN